MSDDEGTDCAYDALEEGGTEQSTKHDDEQERAADPEEGNVLSTIVSAAWPQVAVHNVGRFFSPPCSTGFRRCLPEFDRPYGCRCAWVLQLCLKALNTDLLVHHHSLACVFSWLGTNELAATAFAGIIIQISANMLWQGFGDALIALTSQAVGANNPKLAGIWLQTSLGCICVGAIPIGVVWWFTADILALTGSSGPSQHVRELAGTFARWSLIWLLPDAAFTAFSQWLNGQQLVKPTIAINVVFVVYNVAANILLVHGMGSFKGLGFIGSPIATATTKILRAIVIVWYITRVRKLHETCWHPWTRQAFTCTRIKRFMEQSIPAALVGFLEQAQFVVVTLFVGSLGTPQLAAHSGMLNVFGFVTCGMYGLSDAGASTIGRHLGAGKPKVTYTTEATVAQHASKILLLCMFVVGATVAVLFLATNSVIGHIFSGDAEVWHLAGKLSTICGIAYFLLAMTFASFGTLQGQARPHVAALSMFLGLWGFSVPIGYVFGFVWPSNGLGLVGIWWGLVTGYMFMTVVMVSFVLTSDWALYAEQAQVRSEKEEPLGDASDRLVEGGPEDGAAHGG